MVLQSRCQTGDQSLRFTDAHFCQAEADDVGAVEGEAFSFGKISRHHMSLPLKHPNLLEECKDW